MKHPYPFDFPDESPPARAVAWFVVAAFGAFLLAPWVLALVPRGEDDGGGGRTPRSEGSTLRERLGVLEERVETMDPFARWRRTDQARRLRWLGVGNARVVAGESGWLYYRPDLKAVVGKGPFYEEPASAAREPLRGDWRRPLPVIAGFADQLGARGIDLVLVPVPTKPMACRTGLGLTPGSVTHPDYERLLRRLREEGIEVVDPMPLLASLPGDSERFLRRDTHWAPRAMERVARFVAERVRRRLDGAGKVETEMRSIRRSHRGDLVNMLDLPEGETPFPPESVRLRRVVRAGTSATLASDPVSPVVLLGDSFANVYEDPSLGFGAEGETSIGAGFPSHLATALGRRIHVIARNGGGATAVRRTFARLPDETVRAKSAVVWLLSARDLLLAEHPALRAGIRWAPVSFEAASAGRLEPEPDPDLAVTATLTRRSRIPDPTDTPYSTAIYSALFEEIEGESGGVPAGAAGEMGALYVFLWAFRERERHPAADLRPGRRYHLELVPLAAHEAAGRATALDDLFRSDLQRWFAVAVEEVE